MGFYDVLSDQNGEICGLFSGTYATALSYCTLKRGLQFSRPQLMSHRTSCKNSYDFKAKNVTKGAVLR
jgi:hypothetical protein